MKKQKILYILIFALICTFLFGLNFFKANDTAVFASSSDQEISFVRQGLLGETLTITYFETTTGQTLENFTFEDVYKALDYQIQVSIEQEEGEFEFLWYYSQNSDPKDFVELSEQTLATINIKSCSQSGYYFCRITIDEGDTCDSAEIFVNIIPKEIAVERIDASDKEYDGQKNIEADIILNKIEDATLPGVFDGDDVTCLADASVANPRADEDKFVYFSNLVLDGDDSSNYTIPTDLNLPIVFVNINKKPVVLVWETLNQSVTYTYNGADQIKSIKAHYVDISGGKVYLHFNICGSVTFDEIPRYYINEFLNTGTYIATVILTEKETNYQLTDNSNNPFNSITLYMQRTDPFISIDNTTFVYTGLLQDASRCVSINNTEQTLEFSNNTFTTVSQGNSLSVHVFAAQSLNFFEANRTFNINVLKGTAEIDITNVLKNYTYKGFEQVVSQGAIIDNNEQTLAYQNNTFTTVSQGNNLLVSVYANSTDNYNYVSKTFNINVLKAIINMSGCAWYAPSFVYNGNTRSVFLINYDNLLLTPYYIGNTASKAGSYLAKVSFVLSDSENYNPVSFESCEWSISKASVTKPTINSAQTTFNGFEQIFTINTSPYYSISNNKATYAGVYQVQVALKSIANTQWADETTDNLIIEWEIKKAKVLIPQLELKSFYNGREQSLKIEESLIYTMLSVKATAVGEYDVFIVLKDVNNYEWENTTDAYINMKWNIIGNEQVKPTPILTIVLSSVSILILAVYLTLHFTVRIKKRKRKSQKSKNSQQ